MFKIRDSGIVISGQSESWQILGITPWNTISSPGIIQCTDFKKEKTNLIRLSSGYHIIQAFSKKIGLCNIIAVSDKW